MKIAREFETILSQRIKNDLNFIQVVLGPRQVGKTTGVKSIFDAYAGTKLFASADSPIPYNSDWLEAQWNNAEKLGKGTLLVIDEIHKVNGWSETCKYLFDRQREKKTLKIILLGSASLSIQDGLASALAGRFELIKVNHWDYKESKKAFGWDLETFIKYGGYPAASELLPDHLRWQSYIRDSIIESVLGKDISGLIRINKPALFRQTFKLSVLYPAQVISYQKILGQLQDKGNAATVKNYLELIEAAFLIKRIEKFSGSVLNRAHTSPKLIPLAPALSNAFLDDLKVLDDPTWMGHVLECVVGARLLEMPGTVYYWSEANYEVDFVRIVNDEIFAYEIKHGLNYKTKSLDRFKKIYPKAKIEILDNENIENWLLTNEE